MSKTILVDHTRYSLQLNEHYLKPRSDRRTVIQIGSRFSLEATIKIDLENTPKSTIFGGGYSNGLWLGVDKKADGSNKLELRINGVSFFSTTLLKPRIWEKVNVNYDGNRVWFSISGTYEPEQGAVLGDVHVESSEIIIGADAGSGEEAILRPFIGRLCDLRIWHSPINPLESNNQINTWQSFLLQQQSTADLIYHNRIA